MPKLGDYLKSINMSKENLMRSGYDPELAKKDYVPYVINKIYSYFPDTIFYANRMNQFHFLPKEMHYEFYLYGIRKQKRFQRIEKPEISEKIKILQDYFHFSYHKCKEIEDLINEETLNTMRMILHKGGKEKSHDH